MQKKLRNRLPLLSLFLFFNVLNLLGQTNTYTGSSGGNWNNGSNWSLGVPTSAHDVVIPNNRDVTVNTAAVCKTFTINGGGGANTISLGSNSLTVTNGITIDAPTSNNTTKTIAVQTGILTCGSVTMATTSANSRDCRITTSSGTVNVSGNVTMNGLPQRNQIRINGTGSNGGTLNIGGSLTGGDLLSSNDNSTVNFNGTSAQTIPINADYIYNKIVVNNTVGATLQAAVTATNVTDNITVQTGTFNNGGFAIAGNASKVFTVSNGATFTISGTTSAFPSGFGTITLGASSTVDYSGSGAQTIFDVASPGYGNLRISTSGTKTAVADIDVQGTVNVANTAVFSMTGILTVAGASAVTVASGAALTLENNSSLIQSGYTGANSGSINVKRNTTPIILDDYTYWSSPTNGIQTLLNFSPLTQTDKFFTYNAAWVGANTSSTFAPGMGYAIRSPEAISISVPAVTAFQFTGVPNNGTINVPVTVIGDVMVGNPYPSTLDADAFIDANIAGLGTINQTILGKLYFWTHNHSLSGNNYLATDYAYYTKLGGTAVPTGTGNTATPTRYIASGEGFFVETTTASGNITFNNSMRVGANNTNFYRPLNMTNLPATDFNRIWINLSNSTESISQTLIGYIEGASNGYDIGYDGYYDGGDGHVLYSMQDESMFNIQARGIPFYNTDMVAMGYTVSVAGSTTIAIDHYDGLFLDGQNIYLEDLLLDVIHDLKESPYVFTSDAGTFNNRFVLRYTAENLAIDELDASKSFKIATTKITIQLFSPQENIQKIVVYDMLGREVYSNKNLNTKEFTISNQDFGHQTLIVKAYLSDGKTITKKIIQ